MLNCKQTNTVISFYHVMNDTSNISPIIPGVFVAISWSEMIVPLTLILQKYDFTENIHHI